MDYLVAEQKAVVCTTKLQKNKEVKAVLLHGTLDIIDYNPFVSINTTNYNFNPIRGGNWCYSHLQHNQHSQWIIISSIYHLLNHTNVVSCLSSFAATQKSSFIQIGLHENLMMLRSWASDFSSYASAWEQFLVSCISTN